MMRAVSESGEASMPITVAGPFGNFNPQVSKMMEQLTKGYYNFLPSEVFTPNVNLYETENDYQVCVDLAGVEKDKIDIVVVDQRLQIRGSRPVPPCPSPPCPAGDQRQMRVHLMEIDHGAFAREVELPEDVVTERISAKYIDGLLWIELPKK
jgi:HSP20 family protein